MQRICLPPSLKDGKGEKVKESQREAKPLFHTSSLSPLRRGVHPEGFTLKGSP
jgi:hypothetical protein